MLAKAKADLQAEKSKRRTGTSAIQHHARILELQSVVSLQEKAVMEANFRLEEVMAEWKERRARRYSPRRPRMSKRGKAVKQYGGAIADRITVFEVEPSEDEMAAVTALLNLKHVWVMNP